VLLRSAAGAGFMAAASAPAAAGRVGSPSPGARGANIARTAAEASCEHTTPDLENVGRPPDTEAGATVIRDPFTLTDSRPGIDAHRSSGERRVRETGGTRGDRASHPQMGRRDRHGSMRARRPRPRDAPFGGRAVSRTPAPGSGAVPKASAALIRPDRAHPREPVPQRETTLTVLGRPAEREDRPIRYRARFHAIMRSRFRPGTKP